MSLCSCVLLLLCVRTRPSFVHSVSGCRESLVPLESWNWRGCVETSVEEHSCLGLLCRATLPSLLLLLLLCLFFLSFFLSLSHTHTFNCSLLITLSYSIQKMPVQSVSLLSASLFCLSEEKQGWVADRTGSVLNEAVSFICFSSFSLPDSICVLFVLCIVYMFSLCSSHKPNYEGNSEYIHLYVSCICRNSCSCSAWWKLFVKQKWRHWKGCDSVIQS